MQGIPGGAIPNLQLLLLLYYMKYHSADRTESFKNLAQKVSHMLLKLNKHILSTKGHFPNGCHSSDVIRDSPLM